MSPDTRSAIARAARTAIQVVAAWAVTMLVVRVPSLDTYRGELTLLCTVVLAAVFSWLWRRFLDPSSVPSLLDPDTAAVLGGPWGNPTDGGDR